MRRFLPALLLLGCGGGINFRATELQGWNPVLFLEAPEAGVRAMLAPPAGGRILEYSLNGQNVIFENADGRGKTMLTHPKGFWAGGYNIDIGPEDRPPSHPTLWNGIYSWETARGNAIRLTSQKDPTLGLTMIKEVRFDPRTGSIHLKQVLRNDSDKEHAYCLWDRTLVRPGGFAFFPLNPKSRFPARWALGKRLAPTQWEYNGVDPSHPNMKAFGDVVVARCSGKEAKLGADSDGGWVAYALGKILFVKHYPFYPGRTYPDSGLSVEVYFSDRIGELEPLSPEATLKPGEEYVFPEIWTLTPLEKEVTTFEEARDLARRITKITEF